jgi:bifunctional NMN adenylyltransferase/nudix hydrolase
MYDYAIYIGRFQPFHNAHLASVRFALQKAAQLIIVIGSDKTARNIKNPWTSAERIAMISACLTDEELSKVQFVTARDYVYNNNLWITSVQQLIRERTKGSKNVALVGFKKDDSSFYLKLFKEWTFLETGVDMPRLDATRARECIFRQDTLTLNTMLPTAVYNMMLNYMGTDEFKRLHEEFHHIEDYRAAWKDAPFPPTFVTVDAIVICSGHVLVVRRRGAPGKGLMALPGGFLNQKEEIVDGMLRELEEETKIDVSAKKLQAAIVQEHVFSHPGRSLRGRTITHAYCIDLGHRDLPKVKGSDDAEKAWWVPLSEVHTLSDQFFEDHWHMIQFFTSRF